MLKKARELNKSLNQFLGGHHISTFFFVLFFVDIPEALHDKREPDIVNRACRGHVGALKKRKQKKEVILYGMG